MRCSNLIFSGHSHSSNRFINYLQMFILVIQSAAHCYDSFLIEAFTQSSQTVWEVQISRRLATSSTFLGGSVSFVAEHINSEGTSITAASCPIDQLISWT